MYGEFKKADRDGSGTVSWDELVGAIYASMEGPPPNPMPEDQAFEIAK